MKSFHIASHNPKYTFINIPKTQTMRNISKCKLLTSTKIQQSFLYFLDTGLATKTRDSNPFWILYNMRGTIFNTSNSNTRFHINSDNTQHIQLSIFFKMIIMNLHTWVWCVLEYYYVYFDTWKVGKDGSELW